MATKTIILTLSRNRYYRMGQSGNNEGFKYMKFSKWLEKREMQESNSNKALENKAKKSGVSKSILKQVFNRGKAAWNSGHRPGVSQDQWAYGRVNSFLTGVGGARKADKDLWAKAKKSKK